MVMHLALTPCLSLLQLLLPLPLLTLRLLLAVVLAWLATCLQWSPSWQQQPMWAVSLLGHPLVQLLCQKIQRHSQMEELAEGLWRL